MLELGAVYNGKPEDYYGPIKRGYFNSLVYFETTQSSMILK
jgi:hypothetical protein